MYECASQNDSEKTQNIKKGEFAGEISTLLVVQIPLPALFNSHKLYTYFHFLKVNLVNCEADAR